VFFFWANTAGDMLHLFPMCHLKIIGLDVLQAHSHSWNGFMDGDARLLNWTLHH